MLEMKMFSYNYINHYSLVIPHLEFSFQAGRLYYQNDINLIEGVQRRATKLI